MNPVEVDDDRWVITPAALTRSILGGWMALGPDDEDPARLEGSSSTIFEALADGPTMGALLTELDARFPDGAPRRDDVSQFLAALAERQIVERVPSGASPTIAEARPTRRVRPARLRVLNLLNSDHRRGAEAFGADLGRALRSPSVEVTTAALTASGAAHTFDVAALGRGQSATAVGVVRLGGASRRADVIVAHGGRTLLAAAIVNATVGTPFVYRVIGEPRFWAGRPDRRVRVRAALRRAARVVVYYPEVATELVSTFGLDRARIEVIPKGVSAEGYVAASEDDAARARSQFGIGDRRGPVIGYLGAVSRPKNVEQIIEAAASIPNATVLVVGDGDDRPRLQSVADARQVDVVFAGPSPRPVDALCAADVIALTSRTEGMPSVLIEAGLVGRPVVATRVGGVAHIVDDRRTGILVDVDDVRATADALRSAIEARDELGGAARQRCLTEFDMTAAAHRWEALLRSVVAEA